MKRIGCGRGLALLLLAAASAVAEIVLLFQSLLSWPAWLLLAISGVPLGLCCLGLRRRDQITG
jgi:hypothetical protein